MQQTKAFNKKFDRVAYKYKRKRVGSNMTVDAIKATMLPEGKSFYQMAMMYATGRDCEFDLVAAHCWFNIAAARGDREAVQRRAELAAEMSSMEISMAQRAAREWLSVH